jgi:hypothetical protein
LADQRAPYVKYMNEHPEVKRKLAGLLVSEEPSREGRTGTAETFFNRMISHGIPPEKMGSSVEGLASGRGVYYQPLQPGGTYGDSERRLSSDPRLLSETMEDIDKAGGGSNVSNLGTQNASAGVAGSARQTQTVTGQEIKGLHDLWSRKDRPEFARIHGAGTTEREKRWFEQTSAAMAGNVAEDRSMVDKRSVKTVKVDATGSVKVNIGGAGGDATLGSQGLFKPTTPERSTQMEAAASGPKADAPATFKERFEAAN